MVEPLGSSSPNRMHTYKKKKPPPSTIFHNQRFNMLAKLPAVVHGFIPSGFNLKPPALQASPASRISVHTTAKTTIASEKLMVGRHMFLLKWSLFHGTCQFFGVLHFFQFQGMSALLLFSRWLPTFLTTFPAAVNETSCCEKKTMKLPGYL